MKVNRFMKNSDYDASFQVHKATASIRIPSQVVYSQQVFRSPSIIVPQGYYISDMIVRHNLMNDWLVGNLSMIYTTGEEIGDVDLYAYLRRVDISQYLLEIYVFVYGGSNSNRPLPELNIEAKMVFSALPV
jgi:hypothetical protein|nr:MAG TPA: hypothetical protein [Caudoviricetes sp.]DAW32267.1 MAG TPA: hypothetical protein [Caudoviricetes sp.]